jgi:hypothetical protein
VKTSQTVSELGLYASECCKAESIFDIGATFSRCPKCLGLCEWEFQYDPASENVEQVEELVARG